MLLHICAVFLLLLWLLLSLLLNSLASKSLNLLALFLRHIKYTHIHVCVWYAFGYSVFFCFFVFAHSVLCVPEAATYSLKFHWAFFNNLPYAQRSDSLNRQSYKHTNAMIDDGPYMYVCILYIYIRAIYIIATASFSFIYSKLIYPHLTQPLCSIEHTAITITIREIFFCVCCV